MKKISICLLILTYSLGALAQPDFNTKPHRTHEGKKVNHYAKEAKKFVKDGQYNEAVLSAAYALKLAAKKGRISSAQKYLNQSYSKAVQQNLNRIESLKENTKTFNGDQTVTDLAEIIHLYKTMWVYNNVLKEVPLESFSPVKKKDDGFNPEIEDYKIDIDVATEKLEKGKQDAVKMHYADGREYQNQGDKLNFKIAAKHYKWTNEYVPNYRDVVARYEEAKKLGTTRMGLMKFKSGRSQYGDVGAIISDKLLGYLASKSIKLEFFEVVDRNQLDMVIKEQQLTLSGLMDESTTADIGELQGVDVLLVGNITKNYIDRQKTGPVEKSYSTEVTIRTEKYIDNEGNEMTRDIRGTVYAKTSEYRKRADAIVSCSYRVLDVNTGVILYSGNEKGTYSWSDSWVGSATGDERALPYSFSDEPIYPSYDEMINISTNEVVRKIYTELLNYITKVGN
jgi:curli biogenesis system outer membrane secretion channel CsgG